MVNMRQYWDSRLESPDLGLAEHAGARAQSRVARVGGKSPEYDGIGVVGRRGTNDLLRQTGIAFGNEVCGL